MTSPSTISASREFFANMSAPSHNSRNMRDTMRNAKMRMNHLSSMALLLGWTKGGRRLRTWAAGVSLLVLYLTPQAFSQVCTGLCLQQTSCSPGQTTSVSGTVYAPNGTTPLPNVVVYVPNGSAGAPTWGVTPIPPGVACNPNGEPLTGSPLVSTTTNTNGTFTLNNMPVGTNIPLVIQAGRWRRKITISTVTSCTNTALTASETSLPTEQAVLDPADNIPLIAISTGSVDAAECVLQRMGIAESEFSNPVAQGGSGRVRFYLGEGSAGARINASTPSATQLWSGSTPDANQYDVIMFPCQGDEYTKTAAEQANIINYANAGGRVFATHYSYVWLFDDSPFSGTVTWDIDQAEPTPDPQTGYINTGFPKGAQLAQWLQDIGASTTLGQIPLNTLRHDQDGVVAPTQSWLTIDNPRK